ncbi:hypothetical protein HYE68_008828 [Fusarium pseudograminearum]|nr:hypothetical protein HYE68_008828 [Fusarium pseudograminearum]
MAKSKAANNIWAIELGNEPDPPWDETREWANENEWAQVFANHWKSPLPILAGGGYAIPFQIEPGWPNLPYLVNEAYNKTVRAATKVYNGHLYAFSNASVNDLDVEMSHQRTAEDLNLLPISTARSVGRPYIIGETGFHGLDYEMDATFGSAIQTVDKTLRALSIGTQRLFYHQGTINQAFFNWWRSDQLNANFYGAYFGALATAGGDHIVASDNGSDRYAQYIIYRKGKPSKLIFVNTDYYSGIGSRSTTSFTVTGLKSGAVKALRMTGPSSETLVPLKQTNPDLEPSIVGQYFSNQNCDLKGAQRFETFNVKKGKLVTDLKASEALIVYLLTNTPLQKRFEKAQEDIFPAAYCVPQHSTDTIYNFAWLKFQDEGRDNKDADNKKTDNDKLTEKKKDEKKKHHQAILHLGNVIYRIHDHASSGLEPMTKTRLGTVYRK